MREKPYADEFIIRKKLQQGCHKQAEKLGLLEKLGRCLNKPCENLRKVAVFGVEGGKITLRSWIACSYGVKTHAAVECRWMQRRKKWTAFIGSEKANENEGNGLRKSLMWTKIGWERLKLPHRKFLMKSVLWNFVSRQKMRDCYYFRQPYGDFSGTKRKRHNNEVGKSLIKLKKQLLGRLQGFSKKNGMRT